LPAETDGNGAMLSRAWELYDRKRRTFTATGSMTGARELHTATLLPNGRCSWLVETMATLCFRERRSC